MKRVVYRNTRANVAPIVALVKRGEYLQIRRRLEYGPLPTANSMISDEILTVAVREYLKHLDTPLANRYKWSLQAVIDLLLAVQAPVFPVDRNALHTLARRAKTQREYDAVAAVFRERVPNHFRMAHRRQYIDLDVDSGGSLSGRLSRASSILALRRIDASKNRPRSSGGRPLGASRIRNAVPVVISKNVLDDLSRSVSSSMTLGTRGTKRRR